MTAHRTDDNLSAGPDGRCLANQRLSSRFGIFAEIREDESGEPDGNTIRPWLAPAAASYRWPFSIGIDRDHDVVAAFDRHSAYSIASRKSSGTTNSAMGVHVNIEASLTAQLAEHKLSNVAVEWSIDRGRHSDPQCDRTALCGRRRSVGERKELQ